MSPQNTIVKQLQPVIIGNNTTEVLPANNQMPSVIWLVYGAGVLVMLVIFLTKLYRLRLLTKQHEIVNYQNYKIVLLRNHSNAFSLFNYIFIDESLFKNNHLSILAHEQVHLTQKHWLDLWFLELLKIVFWFNPLIYIYQAKLKEVHEYIADTIVLQKTDKVQYFNRLLQTVFQTNHISFINQFYKPSLIKKRIKMQQKKHSGWTAKVKYAAAIIGLISIISVIDACKNTDSNPALQQDQKAVEHQKVSTETMTDQNNQDIEVAFQFIENAPVYPGCEGKTGQELKDCMSQHIQKFVNRHFNTDVASDLGLVGQPVRILTMFTIGKDGRVTNIKTRSKYKPLEDEAKRVLAQLPQMQPGKQKDQPVAVTYTLPIIFKVQK
jgi:hypothetical protein